jgi:type I restriction enzyme S subunit
VEVRAGYKRTEVGVIPKGWEVKKLGEIALYWNGKPYESYIREDGRFCLITLDSIDIEGKLKSEHERVNFHDGSLAKDDLVMVLSDVAHGDFLGLTDVIPESGQYVLNQRIGALRASKDVLPTFLSNFINSNQKYFKTVGQGSSQQNLSKSDVLSLDVLVPPLPEQRAIAEALSNVDALIAALDRLIAKKRAIKQGAMQQFLAGQTRLPGFSGPWETRRLGEILDYEQPSEYLVKDAEYTDTGIPVLTAGKTFILGYTDEQEGIYRNLPVIVFDDFTTASRYVDFPFKVKSSAIKLLRVRNGEADLQFVFGKMQILKFAVGDHKRYYISEYQYIEIDIPPLPEQRAIAAVLSDMDAEIAALEARREKTRALKQGMMQELLTGRIRLVGE